MRTWRRLGAWIGGGLWLAALLWLVIVWVGYVLITYWPEFGVA